MFLKNLVVGCIFLALACSVRSSDALPSGVMEGQLKILSRKAFDIRRASKVGLIFQDADDAFVVLAGRAMLLEGASSMRQLWKDEYNVYFPGEEDRANATFVEVNVGRMELWLRGVTPEPFGMHTTRLERNGGGTWRLSPD